jgi:hypothetical protein
MPNGVFDKKYCQLSLQDFQNWLEISIQITDILNNVCLISSFKLVFGNLLICLFF